ncbi:MAG: flagellar motor switch protein FliG [Gammaproteobacteria bacterium]|nr:flagellar motor switch protein FliG [Gammaproteobacteria bacterium]
MVDKKDALTGVDRAAILLMSIGEQEAAEVLKYIGPKEVHRVSTAMAALKNISQEQADGVLGDFCETADNETTFGVGSDEYLKSVLIKALGEDKAGSVIDRVLMGTSSSGLEQLKWMDPRAVVEVIRLEHPQIISVVLSYLDAEQAAEVISLLPEKVRLDVLLRVATLDRLQPAALEELNNVIEKQFVGNTAVKSATVGGIKTAANILNFMDSAEEGLIMDQITEFDNELSESIQDLMFVFADLSEIDDRGIQALLREVSSETLILALKGSEPEMQSKIFDNMSKRASEMLKDDLEARGPVKLSEVETAQKEVLAIARRMAESGDIQLGGKSSEEYV